MLISWSLTAPYCIKWARQGRLGVTWALTIGIIPGLPGLLKYWIYFKVKAGVKKYAGIILFFPHYLRVFSPYTYDSLTEWLLFRVKGL
jgi:hypothetical protein